MEFSPILIQVYTRKQHFIDCVESLVRCRGAECSTLFISSDQGKDDKAKEIVAQIRQYCETIKGFANVEVFAYDSNLGAVETFWLSTKKIFSKYDRLIYSEDDNIFSPNYLEYMNSAMEYYHNNEKVFSVCGYKHPFVMPANYKYDVFCSTLTSAWGIGLWRDKYGAVDFRPRGDFWKEKQKWNKKLAISWYELMEAVFSKGECFGDALMEYHCLKHGMVNIFPRVSLVKNKGNDGSGDHCKINIKYREQQICIGDETFSFIDDLIINKKIEKRQIDSIDFPFIHGYKLLYPKFNRKMKKILRDFVTQRPKLKRVIKQFI